MPARNQRAADAAAVGIPAATATGASPTHADARRLDQPGKSDIADNAAVRINRNERENNIAVGAQPFDELGLRRHRRKAAAAHRAHAGRFARALRTDDDSLTTAARRA